MLPTSSIGERVVKAAYRLAGNEIKRRVTLADLHDAMPQVPLEALHAAVRELQQQSVLVAMGMDNMAERTPRIEAAAFSIAGNPRHLVYLLQKPSNPTKAKTVKKKTSKARAKKSVTARAAQENRPKKRRKKAPKRMTVPSKLGPIPVIEIPIRKGSPKAIRAATSRVSKLKRAWVAAEKKRKRAQLTVERLAIRIFDAEARLRGMKRGKK